MMNKFFVKILCCFVPLKKWRKKIRKILLNNTDSKLMNDGLENEVILYKKNGETIKNPTIEGLKVDFWGKDSKVIIYEPYNFSNCYFCVGNNNLITIKSTKYFVNNFEICYPMSDYSEVFIDEDFSCCGCKIYIHDEPKQKITIGYDCMFSFNISIWPSDGHTIYDEKTKEVLNNVNGGACIGSHVWLGRGVNILKNSRVPDNCVVGLNTVITKSFSEKGCIIAGQPGKIIKKGINWDRSNTYEYKKILNMEKQG